MLRDRLDFGKHAYEPLSSVPSSYLIWLLREVMMTERFRNQVDGELRRRRTGPSSPGRGERPRQHRNPAPPVDWGSVVRQWYRQLALDYHPDRGGSNEAMAALNDAYDRLRELVGV